MAALSSVLALAYFMLIGSWPAAVVAVLSAGLVYFVWRQAAPNDLRIGGILGLRFAIGLLVVAGLQLYAEAVGHPTYVIGDDGTYRQAMRSIVAFIHGEVPHDIVLTQSELLGPYGYLGAMLMLVFGDDLLLPVIPNVLFATLSALVAIDMCRRLFGQRGAKFQGVVIAFWPSAVLWSSVSMKEALVVLCIGLVLRATVDFQTRPRALPLLEILVALVILETSRRFLFLGLAPLAVLGIALTPGLRRFERIRWTSVAGSAALVLLAFDLSGAGRALPSLQALEGRRVTSSVLVGARSGFIDTVTGEAGHTFVVLPPPGASGRPSASPRASVIVVGSGTRIVLAPSVEAESSPAPSGVVYVQPGDVVVLGPPGTTPRPHGARTGVDIPPDKPLTLIQGTDETAGARTLAHLPRGIAYSLFAPFPWAPRSLSDLVTVPEVLAWYAFVALAAISVWRYRSDWRRLLVPLLFVVGTLGTMALAEGNVGTAFRHRGMVIPIVVVLSTPQVVWLLDRRPKPWR